GGGPELTGLGAGIAGGGREPCSRTKVGASSSKSTSSPKAGESGSIQGPASSSGLVWRSSAKSKFALVSTVSSCVRIVSFGAGGGGRRFVSRSSESKFGSSSSGEAYAAEGSSW